MSFTFKLRSHTKMGQPFESGQLLVDHLKGVRDIALKANKDHGLGNELDEVISIICLCHDFGKASSYFQSYLKGTYKDKLKNHGEISAYFTYYMLPEKWKFIGFMCVKKHHGNMYPEKKFFNTENQDDLMLISEDLKNNIVELNEIYGDDISGFFDIIKDGKYFKEVAKLFINKFDEFTIEELVYTQYLWSLVLTGDKSQLIRKGNPYENKINISEEYVQNYRKILINEVKERIKGIENTDLFKVRNKVYDDVIEEITKADLNKERVFSINLPTGTGKTICAFGAAFKIFERLVKENQSNIRPAIVYCLPFTSIIDQNYEVLEKIISTNGMSKYDDLILKHHSMTPLEYKYQFEDEELEFRNYDARFCVENWQSTVITTTFVQLFNTLFKVGINSIGNRFHRLAGSIIIVDEVQAIPPKYYKIIEDIFQILCSKFNTYVITVTATKPLFLSGKELVKKNVEYFNMMNRIEIQNNTDKVLSLNEFSEVIKEDIELNKGKSFLIILNTIKSSRFIAEQLRLIDRKVIYLSTEICPYRRLEIINEIKENRDEKYVLVSTQLIEAGVDVDFDIVYRDFSTMDSINQTAGRANRNALKGKGLVKLFSLVDVDNKEMKYCNYIYPDSLLIATERILKGKSVIEEKDIYEINQQYFEKVNAIKSDDAYRNLNKAISQIDFKNIGNLFQLIENNYSKEDIIINLNDEAQKSLDIIENQSSEYQEVLNAWRVLNKYKVAVYKKDMDTIPSKQFKGINLLDKEDYDEKWGIKRINSLFC